MPALLPPSLTPSQHASPQDVPLKCAYCGGAYSPEKKNRNHQIYCSASCRALAKRKRDKRHKEAYRKKEKYRKAKSAQNKRYREKTGWTEYMRQYREGHRQATKSHNQKAARAYYEQNKRRVAFRRSELRWQKKLRAEIEALKKVSQ